MYTHVYTHINTHTHILTHILGITKLHPFLKFQFIILRFILAFPQSSFVHSFFHRETLSPKNLNIFVHFFNPVIHLK